MCHMDVTLIILQLYTLERVNIHKSSSKYFQNSLFKLQPRSAVYIAMVDNKNHILNSLIYYSGKHLMSLNGTRNNANKTRLEDETI